MRRGRKKGGSREKVFGCDLLEHLTSTMQEIPQVLRSCSEFIEEHGVVDGIYRLSGVSSNTQKLRSEFDSEGTPDFCKDVYLQDIHCVSSVCKAYFRELPNPLLTYELYDHFADAVAVQLEDERLVKIKEVLKDLPLPHYRTLEFLMRHLVKMSTHASQTNMHTRNLAIVWAPNLLKVSKDIESTGFNGTAAFMEVRVQSIVVEFILTHVTELFPGTGLVMERRKSLPSPSVLSKQDEKFFKSLPLHCSGNLSPGDGPPLMRPYHAIIDGTDKRKGSLKGRKWMSIFNLGGRLHDPRKKSKYCAKDKEKTKLRPAKSMDSLSSGPYAVDDSQKHPQTLPLVLSVASGSSEGVSSVGGGVSSGYAVTYRRTGGAQVSMVSGGTSGTYNRLDSGGGAIGGEGPSQGVSRSPAVTSKADRRAGIHISGPFSVTVPLHITSGLALGVLQGGWNEKEEEREEDQPETEEERTSADGDSRTERRNSDVEESRGDSKSHMDSQDVAAVTGKENAMPEERDISSTRGAEKGTMKAIVEDAEPQNETETVEEDYIDMRGHLNYPLPSVYVECPDQDFPLDFQEAFGFLDLMDSSASNQVEFSVEPPCFEEEDEEEEDENKDSQALYYALQNHSNDFKAPAAKSISPTFTRSPLPGKSHSLPYKSRPFMPALSLSSDEEYSPVDDEDDDDSDKGSEYEDMFCQSLPSSRDFQGLSWSCPQTSASTNSEVDVHSSNQSECLDEAHRIHLPESGKDAQSISQSEDVILTATTMLDDSEEHLSSDVTKMINPQMDEERESEDVKDDMHALTVEDNPESEASEEDTYFGPDSTPSSPEPNQSETSITVHDEPIPGQFPDVETQPMLDADGYQDNTASDVITTGDLTATDSASSATQDEVMTDPPPEEEKTVLGDCKMNEEMRRSEEDETEEQKKTEEATEEGTNILELKTTERDEKWRENEEEKAQEMEEFAPFDEVVQDAPVEGCSDEKVEQERNDLEEDDGEKTSNVGGSEEDANDQSDIVMGRLSHEEIFEEKEDDSNRGDLEQSTFKHQPDEAPCGKMDKKMEEEAVIQDVGLPQSLVPELARASSAPNDSSCQVAYQAKAVPVVPPKPQNSKLTTFTLRQHHQHSQLMDMDGPHVNPDEMDKQYADSDNKQRENEKEGQTYETAENCKKQSKETVVAGMSRDDGTKQERDRPVTWDGGIDWREDVVRETEREVKRNSAASVCFDEAVARATVKRSRERENTDRVSGVQRDRENRRDGSKNREKEDENKTD
ncbi:rho GTPase-activating protein 31-like [Xyrauchen texanus]|uniref:rho GTPase-activating protein 31-like n=1 Tax=Xyrauchen texanus TaxID=154827 RepID=UPI00224288B5|nr:rho GTPase-activating protein 31-like [Xyrauchen texanus]